MVVEIALVIGVVVLLLSVTGLILSRPSEREKVQPKVLTDAPPTPVEKVPAATATASTEPTQLAPESDELGPLARLPPFAPVVVRLLRLCDQEDVEVTEVARLVESDSVVSSELLALVNSPRFGVSGTISSAGHAITMLGAGRTRSLATSLAVRFMSQSIPDKNMVRRFWRHSLATALLAHQLARVFRVDADLAHTAAMLHDLGRLGLLAAHRAAYVQLATKSYETTEDILDAERTQFGLSHCSAGRLIARAWGFPEALQTVIAHHHEAPAGRDMLSLVQISCELADSFSFVSVPRWDVSKPAAVVETRALPEFREQILAALPRIEDTIVNQVEELDF